jgi:hypothetical protein
MGVHCLYCAGSTICVVRAKKVMAVVAQEQQMALRSVQKCKMPHTFLIRLFVRGHMTETAVPLFCLIGRKEE